jgi:hypothetical protein
MLSYDGPESGARGEWICGGVCVSPLSFYRESVYRKSTRNRRVEGF